MNDASENEQQRVVVGNARSAESSPLDSKPLLRAQNGRQAGQVSSLRTPRGRSLLSHLPLFHCSSSSQRAAATSDRGAGGRRARTKGTSLQASRKALYTARVGKNLITTPRGLKVKARRSIDIVPNIGLAKRETQLSSGTRSMMVFEIVILSKAV